MNIVLSTFREANAAVIASWPGSIGEARAWAGSGTPFPFVPDQFRVWHDDSDVRPFVGHQDGDLVAYGELWLDHVEQELELARIIVHPAHRGAGVGRRFVRALVEHASIFGLPDFFLRALPDNLPAIRCYEAAGFERVSPTDQETYNRGQPSRYLWLKYSRHFTG